MTEATSKYASDEALEIRLHDDAETVRDKVNEHIATGLRKLEDHIATHGSSECPNVQARIGIAAEGLNADELRQLHGKLIDVARIALEEVDGHPAAVAYLSFYDGCRTPTGASLSLRLGLVPDRFAPVLEAHVADNLGEILAGSGGDFAVKQS